MNTTLFTTNLPNRTMNFINRPIVIDDNEVCIYGIFRGIENSKKIVVFIPALTGTRIGPQRMFVEISNHLNKLKISTVCFDLPLSGDSFDKKKLEHSSLRIYYDYYLLKIYNKVKQKHQQSEIIFCSISVGCMPTLEFSERHRLDKVLLLSPNHLSKKTTVINKRNIYAYFIKLFQLRTWEKFFLFNINFNKIFFNIFNMEGKVKTSNIKKNNSLGNVGKVNLLCVFGKNDPELQENLSFWAILNKQNRFISYKEDIVSNSDHSFMSWGSKMNLINHINDWLN